MRESRNRHWATILYMESAPFDALNKIKDLKVPGFISPLHDSDVIPETGEIKKPHWHVLLTFPGKKSRSQIIEIFKDFGGVGAEAIHSFTGHARYLCHLDDKDKAQYKIEDVIELSGASYADTIAAGCDSMKTFLEITKWIDEQKEDLVYRDVVQYARDSNRFDWCKVLFGVSGGNAVTRYLYQRSTFRKKEIN